MNTRKDDYKISLFGLPKCHFEFSRDEIDRMQGFKYNFERLLDTDFIKNRMDKTPVVFAGKIQDMISDAAWSDFIQKFRHFILQKDQYNYKRVTRIAFRHPRSGPSNLIRRQMDRAIDNQRKISDDAFENDGMFDFKTGSGETISAFEMWNKYVYTYNFHVNYSSQNKDLLTLKAFGFNPENPNALAHFASCLVIKVAAFERVHDHICDILHFTENPNAPENEYHHRSRPRSTESYLEDGQIEYVPIKDLHGSCLLGDDENRPYENIGLVMLTLIVKGIEIKEWRYSGGFHMLADILREVNSAEACIKFLEDGEIAAARRLICSARNLIVRGDKFLLRAEILGSPAEFENDEMRLRLNVTKIKMVIGKMLGPAAFLN